MTGKDGIPVIIDPIMLLNRGQMAKVDLEKWRVMCINDPKKAVRKMAGYIYIAGIICALNAFPPGKTLSDSSKRALDTVEERGRYMQEHHPKLFEEAVDCYKEMIKRTRLWKKD